MDNNSNVSTPDLAVSTYITNFNSGYSPYAFGTYDLRQAFCQVEGRHPFFDRRIAEFAISLPESLRRRGGLNKFILRSAGKERLPKSVLHRLRKSEYSWLFYKAFTSQLFLKAVQEMEIDTLGWVSKKRFTQYFDENIACFNSNPAGPCPKTWPLWFAYAINFWYCRVIKK